MREFEKTSCEISDFQIALIFIAIYFLHLSLEKVSNVSRN